MPFSMPVDILFSRSCIASTAASLSGNRPQRLIGDFRKDIEGSSGQTSRTVLHPRFRQGSRSRFGCQSRKHIDTRFKFSQMVLPDFFFGAKERRSQTSGPVQVTTSGPQGGSHIRVQNQGPTSEQSGAQTCVAHASTASQCELVKKGERQIGFRMVIERRIFRPHSSGPRAALAKPDRSPG